MYQLNLKSIGLPVTEIIAIEVLGGGFEHPNLGEVRLAAACATA